MRPILFQSIHRNMLQTVLRDINNTFIGHSRTFVQDNSAHLACIEISPHFRHLGFGSQLLNETEQSIRTHFQVSQIKLLAWLPDGSDIVVDFYKRNGFLVSNHTSMVYDDYTHVYDLVQMYKPLSTPSK